jgi:Holliday junction resolvase YEN1
MGISGVFKEIGPGQRCSLAKLSSDHYVAHSRPFRLAIDISIWLFQIQAGKGGSNPALRTFYYRLLRLLTLNIHPLFVFDGPNKPLFKRNKRVGGPGVRVASVPEFLAKQLLKQFGFPWHVAPGEAEAECALLEREGIVDAVLSEDVDTLMFGSGVTLRNWTSEGSSKTPTHVNVYRAPETKKTSGLDREGMILVALMSGGDYITEGIPGCGPKLACDAARAGFGHELVNLAKRRDMAGLQIWRTRIQHEIKTNESKHFSRKNTKLIIPDEFPNREVLGYYTHPCVSTPDKLERLRMDLKWDRTIDFTALRSFTADAFDWRCLGGAKKFIRNLAPAMLVRQLREMSESDPHDGDAQGEYEKQYVLAIHGKRQHKTTDNELEYRISFIPQAFVPIDLDLEEEDDEFTREDVGADDEWAQQSAHEDDSEAPASPRKRNPKPYHPDQPEKLWMLRSFLKIVCPLLVEEYEDLSNDPKEFFRQRRAARDVSKGVKKKAAPKKKKTDQPPLNFCVMKNRDVATETDEETPKACKTSTSHFAKFTKPDVTPPRRKRRSNELASPQKSIASYFSPSPRKNPPETINLLSSSPIKTTRPTTPTPERPRDPEILLDSVTRRRKPLKRAKTLDTIPPPNESPLIEAIDLANSPPKITLPKTKKKKQLIIPRESLPGAWKEVEAIDLSGDGSGWMQSGGRAEIWGTQRGWRKSGIEVLDLTGA